MVRNTCENCGHNVKGQCTPCIDKKCYHPDIEHTKSGKCWKPKLSLREQYRRETKTPTVYGAGMMFTEKYVKWLEAKLNEEKL